MQIKSYRVGIVAGEPNYDSMPVAKITDYPLERRDYKPFAQCVLCVGGERLYLRMWAFELSPMPTSALACVMYPWPDQPDKALCLSIEHGQDDAVDAQVYLLVDGQETTVNEVLMKEVEASLERHPHNGEDLQGVYWGESLSLPLGLVERLGGAACAFRPGNTIPGNFYKTCADERFAHMGSLFRADFPDNPCSRESMGAFEIIKDSFGTKGC